MHRLFILLFVTQSAFAQCELEIIQSGKPTDTLFIGDYDETVLKKINDTTLIYSEKVSDPPNCIFIVIDRNAHWFTRVWLDPKIKNKKLIINYSLKTAIIKNPSEWDKCTEKILLLEAEYKNEEEAKYASDYIEKKPDSYLSLWLLPLIENQNQRAVLFKKLNPSLSKYKEYQQMQADLTQRKFPVIGDSFKEFSLRDIKDSTFSSISLKNKYILLHFWGTFCVPCVKEMDALVQFYNSLDTSRFAFISIALDEDRNKWKNNNTSRKIKWTNLCDENNWYGDLCLNYNVNAVPFFIIFNKEKKIHLITFGDELELVKSTLLSIQK